MHKYSLLTLLTAGTLALQPGCAVIDSHSESSSFGTPVSAATLQQIEVGSTTKEWVVATLGTPASATEVAPDITILKYSSRQVTKVKSHLLFLLDTSSRNEVEQTVFFEFKNGVLTRHWAENTETP